MPTVDPLTEAAKRILLAHPQMSVKRAWEVAFETCPDEARAWHHAGDDTGPPPSQAPDLVDPATLLMAHAASRGISFTAACHEQPAWGRAWHIGEMVPAASVPKLPPAGPLTVVKFRAATNATLKAVPIFSTGTWNGRNYQVSHLQSMVKAFQAQHFTVPLSVGHDARPDAPAVGRVSRLWIDGNRLLADFADVAPEVLTGIREGKWLSLSCEVYLDLSRNGEKYPAALRSIAILGAHVPGVDLPDLRAALA